jgi:hypothetical protein
MNYAAQKYHELALDCLNLAEAARDPATQDQVLRLAERWARLADCAEDEESPRWADDLPAFCPEIGCEKLARTRKKTLAQFS